MNKTEAKKQVIKAGRELSETGLIARTWGNVSSRVDDKTFAITASGRNYLTLTEEEVVEVRISDLSYDGGIKPSSEKKIHREIYRLRPEANFVIHTHQENASAVSAMGLSRITLDKEYPGIGGHVICAEYALPGTNRLCANTVKAVEASQGKAVILKHHGAVCYGDSYEEAFQIAHDLEKACGEYLKKQIPRFQDRPQTKEAIQEQAAAVWNCSPVIFAFMKEGISLRPYLDDFAQMAGTSMKVKNTQAIKPSIEGGKPVFIKGRGALCASRDIRDAEALSMLVEKNCKAYFAAKSSGGKSIKFWECFLMRQVYLKKYSKLGE